MNRRKVKKRTLDQTNLLDIIYTDLCNLSYFTSCPASILYLLGNCSEDFSRLFRLTYTYRNKGDHSDFGTLLHLAVIKNRIEIVKILLEKGADIKMRTNNNKSVMDLAIFSSYDDLAFSQKKYLIDFLVTQSPEIKAVHIAALICQNSISLKPSIEQMIHLTSDRQINKTVNISIPHQDNIESDNLPLTHVAAINSNLSAIKILIERKANFRRISEKYWLDIVYCGFLSFNFEFINKFLRFILPLGVNIDGNYIRKKEPVLHFAVRRYYNFDIIRLLLDHGADPNSIFDNRSPLYWTMNMECRKLLLDYGADPNMDTNPSWCALFHAHQAEDLLYLDYHVEFSKTKFDGTSYMHHQFQRNNRQTLLKIYQKIVDTIIKK